MSAALIWSPFGDAESAGQVAAILVEEEWAACANIIPAITSVFRWQGEVMQETEVGVLFKTRTDLLEGAVARLEQLHPYEAPAILAWRADAAPAATLEWLAGATRKEI